MGQLFDHFQPVYASWCIIDIADSISSCYKIHISYLLKINLVSNLFPDEDKWQAYFPEKKSREISKDLYEREERTNGRTKQYYKVINFSRTAMGKRKQGSLFHAISNCSIFVFHFPSTVIRPINGEGAPGGCRSRPHM